MSLLELVYIGQAYNNNRQGLRLPLLLGRIHMGLIFCGNSYGSSRKSSSDNGTLRSFLFIATILITKCREKHVEVSNLSAAPATSRPAFAPAAAAVPVDHGHEDQQDFPLDLIISQKMAADTIDTESGEQIRNGREGETERHVKTLGYFLKGLILPMLISLTLSFGFVIYKNRVKRARLRSIQNALEEARRNPNHLSLQQQAIGHGLVSNALLSVIDARGEWSLISGGSILEGDDYIGEGGETARHLPPPFDKPPDYATVFDPPSYEEATSYWKSKNPVATEGEQSSLLSSSGYHYDEDCDDDEKQLVDNNASSEG